MAVSTSPLLFGDGEHPLYGVHYAPAEGTERGEGILVCPPIGHEYMRAHLAVDRLARSLAAAGFAAFRLDYFATGDSAGATEEGTCERWHESIRHALTELAELAAVSRLSICGMRLGATLAATLDVGPSKIESFVAWDMVMRGADYLARLQEMHDAMLEDPTKFRHQRRRLANDDELLGFRFPAAMRDSIAGLDVGGSTALSFRRCLMVGSFESDDIEIMRRQFGANGACRVELVSEPCAWLDLRSTDNAILANRIPARIVDYLEGAA